MKAWLVPPIVIPIGLAVMIVIYATIRAFT